jgi:hypothetical protein
LIHTQRNPALAATWVGFAVLWLILKSVRL